jgi:hypothetical protein
MERGTDWKAVFVHSRRQRLAERRRRANRLLTAIVAVAGGSVLLLLAAANEVCMPRAEGATLRCTAVGGLPVNLALWALGGVVLVAGLWRVVTVLWS